MSSGQSGPQISDSVRRLVHGLLVVMVGLAFALAMLPFSEDAYAKSRKRNAKSSKASVSRTVARKATAKKEAAETKQAAEADPALAAVSKGVKLPVGEPSKLALESGGARAILLPETAGARISPGASAFTSITISGTGAIDLLAEADGGEIVDLSGNGAQSESAGHGRRLRAKLSAGAPLQLLLELRAAPGGTRIDGKAHNRIRLTLAGAGAPSDSTILGWEVADCSQDYFAALSEIHRARDERMANAIETILTGDDTLPGTWLFARPDVAALGLVAQPGLAKCKKPLKRNDYITGQKVARCPAPKVAAATDAIPVSDTSGEGLMDAAEVVVLAEMFVRAQLGAKAFERKKVLRIVSQQLIGSLRIYLGQSHHVALCSGTEPMLDYYIKHSSPLSDSTARMRLATHSAAIHAAAAIQRLLPQTAATDTAAGTDVSSASLVIPAVADVGMPPPSLGKLIGMVARAVLSPADAALVEASDPMTSLQRFRTLLDAEADVAAATGGVTGTHRIAVEQALGMIEAATYLSKATERFEAISDASFGTAEAIREAHRKTCTCGN